MQIRGYAVGMMLEQDYVSRLATVRLIRPVMGSSQVFIDLLFASSGIEDQIVACADRLEIWPGVVVPVARVGHLVARQATGLIAERGFNRGRDLRSDLEDIVREEHRS